MSSSNNLPTVAQLIAALSKEDPNAVVLVCREGDHPARTPMQVTTVNAIQPLVTITHGVLNRQGNVYKKDQKETGAVTLCVGTRFDEMVIHAFQAKEASKIS